MFTKALIVAVVCAVKASAYSDAEIDDIEITQEFETDARDEIIRDITEQNLDLEFDNTWANRATGPEERGWFKGGRY